MTVCHLMEALLPLLDSNPEAEVLVGRGEDKDWFDEIRTVGKCRTAPGRNGLNCPEDGDVANAGGANEVVVIQT